MLAVVCVFCEFYFYRLVGTDWYTNLCGEVSLQIFGAETE